VRRIAHPSQSKGGTWDLVVDMTGNAVVSGGSGDAEAGRPDRGDGGAASTWRVSFSGRGAIKLAV